MPSRHRFLGLLGVIAILAVAVAAFGQGAAQGTAANARAIGQVGQLSGSCPEVTFVLSGVTVHAGAATKFENGTCAELKEGVQTGAMGIKRADGSIDATRVRLGVTSAPAAAPAQPRAQGAVSGLTGTCPALSFKLGDTAVTTNDKTRFVGGTCGDVKDGARIGAMGPTDASGAMTAAAVRVGPPATAATGRGAAPAEARLQGAVGSMSGACPALTFMLGTTTVHTTDKTRFEGGQCSDVKDGARAGVAGPRAADGSITATMMRLAQGK